MAAKKKAKGVSKKAPAKAAVVQDTRPLWDVDVTRLVKIRIRQRVRADDKHAAKMRALDVTAAMTAGYVIPANSDEEVDPSEGAIKLLPGEEVEQFECDLGEDDDEVAEIRLVPVGG